MHHAFVTHHSVMHQDASDLIFQRLEELHESCCANKIPWWDLSLLFIIITHTHTHMHLKHTTEIFPLHAGFPNGSDDVCHAHMKAEDDKHTGVFFLTKSTVLQIWFKLAGNGDFNMLQWSSLHLTPKKWFPLNTSKRFKQYLMSFLCKVLPPILIDSHSFLLSALRGKTQCSTSQPPSVTVKHVLRTRQEDISSLKQSRWFVQMNPYTSDINSWLLAFIYSSQKIRKPPVVPTSNSSHLQILNLLSLD